MAMFHHENAEENHNLLIASKSFKNVAKFIHFGTTVQLRIAFKNKLRAG
jgi:hypothetical protein